jgi:hypothetical protein
MMKVKLIEYAEKSISRGMIFRLPGEWPYESVVDFMVVDFADADRPHGLVISSGHKAGLILVKLPNESNSDEGRALSTEWVINNWEKWIYPECNVDDVYLLDGYIANN